MKNQWTNVHMFIKLCEGGLMSDRHRVAEQLRQLSRLYVNAQKYRNKYGNMLFSKTDYLEGDKKEWELFFKTQLSKNMDLEKGLDKKMDELLPQHPWSEYLLKIRGVGPVIASSIIGELDGAIYGHIEKDSTEKPELRGYGREFERTSDLWAFAGYAVKDGKAAKRKTGETSAWNNYLKLACYKFSENQIKQGTTYRKVYDDRKLFEQTNHAELTKGHIHARAKRYMIKKFLSDIKHDLVDQSDHV